jgi:hypothetical protein
LTEDNQFHRLYWVISSVVDYPVSIDRLRLIYDHCFFVCKDDLHGSTDDHKGSKDDTVYSRRLIHELCQLYVPQQISYLFETKKSRAAKPRSVWSNSRRHLALNVLDHFKAHTYRTNSSISVYNLQCNSYHQCSS